MQNLPKAQRNETDARKKKQPRSLMAHLYKENNKKSNYKSIKLSKHKKETIAY